MEQAKEYRALLEEAVADADDAGLPVGPGKRGMDNCQGSGYAREDPAVHGWWDTEPDVGRVAHGVASRVDRLKALGNGQVPLQAAYAFAALMASISDSPPPPATTLDK